jgi:hypothetical protein
MRIRALVFVCLLVILAKSAQAQSSILEPIHIPSGTILTFHLQTRLNPGAGNDVDVLPKGTVLRVKMLDPIDSKVDRDGAEFHGVVVSSVVSGDATVVHTDAEARGIFVLLRSRNHPDGFRYELLVTGITDHGRNFDLTASLNPSFHDGGDQPASTPGKETNDVHKESLPAGNKLPVPASSN